MYNLPPSMAHVTFIEIRKNGITTDNIRKKEGMWETSDGESWNATHVRDYIISAALNHCGITKSGDTIYITVHEDV